MTHSLILVVLAVIVVATPSPSEADGLPELFQRVSKSVVVVRAKSRDLVVRDGGSVRMTSPSTSTAEKPWPRG